MLAAAYRVVLLKGTLSALPRACCPASRQEVAPHQSFGLEVKSQTYGSVGRRGCGQAQIRGACIDGCAMCCAGRRGGPALGSANGFGCYFYGILCGCGPLDACRPACESRKRALRRGFDACGRALRRFRVMNRCVRRLALWPRLDRAEPLARCGGRTYASYCGVASLWFAL